ncbi:MAG: PAS domain S-box protein [Calditrichaeota bacterium]|nr:PAS domain S-box protein [Calditrichota bacterium]
MFQNIRIRTKIFWAIFLTVTISMITVIYMIHFHSEKQIVNEYEQIAIEDGKGKARALSNTFSHFERMANQIARSIPDISRWKDYLSNKYDIFPEIKRVFVVDNTGTILFQIPDSTRSAPFSGDSLRLLFSNLTPNREILRSLPNQLSSQKSILILSRITRLDKKQTPIRVLLEVDIPYIFNSVLNYPSEKRMIHYYFVNREGTILFTGDAEKVGRKISTIGPFKNLDREMVLKMFTAAGVRPFEILDRKNRTFIFQEPLESGQFGIVEEENLSPILKGFQPKPGFMGLFIALNLLIIFLISELIAAYFSRPLRSLVTALGSYQKNGILPSLSDFRNRRDEYGILAQEARGYIEEIEKKNQQIQKTLDQLRISEERYFQFLNHSPNMIFVAQNHKIIFVNTNATKILGLKIEDRIDSLNALMFKNLQGRMYPLLNISETYDRFPVEGTLFLDTKDLPVLVYYSKFSYENTDHELFILVDVSRVKQLEIKEKQMEWKLIESNRLASIGILVAGIAHNLNNPLNSIIGFTEILKMKYPDENEINAILKAANQMEKTVLMVTDRNKKEIIDQKMPVQLNELLADSLELLEMNYQFRYQLQKFTDFDPKLPPVFGRYSDFVISLEAFLYNAVEAMEKSEEKTLTVSTRAVDKGIQITISDTGVGIAKEDLDKIFLPFFTTKGFQDPNDNRRSYNTGMGLFMAYRLLETYGTTIDVKSEPNKGTTFIITIPIHSNS